MQFNGILYVQCVQQIVLCKGNGTYGLFRNIKGYIRSWGIYFAI